MNNRFYIINAFTREKYKGNPAAIILLDDVQPLEWMKSLTNELNQPITAFITKVNEKNSFNLKWFTTIKEIDLCGHGTLGAAHILWNEGFASTHLPIVFHTNSGPLKAERNEKEIVLTFQIKKSKPIQIKERLKSIVNFPILNAAWAEDRYILELENEEMVHNSIPNFETIKELEGTGVIITSKGKNKYDFISRYFAPKLGINEDHVTGSSHCALASYWSQKLNKNEFLAFQDSKRGGEIKMKIVGDSVQLFGNCITLIKGRLTF